MAALAAFKLSEPPPVAVFERLRQCVSDAQRAEAPRYAPVLFMRAQQVQDEALWLSRRENEKWPFLRKYGRVEDTADSAAALATAASAHAKAVKDSLQQEMMVTTIAVQQMLQQWTAENLMLVGEHTLRPKIVIAELALKEGKLAFGRHDYLQAVEKVRKASAVLKTSNAQIGQVVQEYFSQAPEWRQWVRDTIIWSAKNEKTAIIVDKLARQCQVYQAGRLQHTFSIEMGPVWLGHKQRQGDDRTPEGRYFVKKKKGKGQTRYFRALEIDYPNTTDLRRFRSAKAAGRIPAGAKIGGLIEIHGDGGKYRDWTAGCVALENRDMEKIFQMAQTGTPVTIVGSLNHE